MKFYGFIDVLSQ